jgi:hypothetical protein
LHGVSVKVEGSDVGTLTDEQGFFTLASSGEQPVLLITYVGYANKEVAITNKRNLNISLKPEAKGWKVW